MRASSPHQEAILHAHEELSSSSTSPTVSCLVEALCSSLALPEPEIRFALFAVMASGYFSLESDHTLVLAQPSPVD